MKLNKSDFKRQLKQELIENILPFWSNHFVDRENGGFYGALTNDLKIRNDVPRSSTLCSRILYAYSAAYRKFDNPDYLEMATRAYNFLSAVFVDHEYGGIYWNVDCKGKPVVDRKHHYAQAFAIYGLSEYYRATQTLESLQLSQTLFGFLEKYAYDREHGGYIESSSRKWEPVNDMRLSDRDPNCRKSMNTMLHLLEAYTNLLRVWNNPELKKQHRAVIDVFLHRIIDRQTRHLKLFFDDAWNSLDDTFSYGHDIEASWLLWEAVQVQADEDLLNCARQRVLDLAEVSQKEAFDELGGLFYEGNPTGVTAAEKAWWVHVEAMVGFYNAFQLTGDTGYEKATYRCWEYIQENFIDRKHGDWFKQLHRDGTPDHSRFKAGPWDCPYHHSRACMQLIDRLQ